MLNDVEHVFRIRSKFLRSQMHIGHMILGFSRDIIVGKPLDFCCRLIQGTMFHLLVMGKDVFVCFLAWFCKHHPEMLQSNLGVFGPCHVIEICRSQLIVGDALATEVMTRLSCCRSWTIRKNATTVGKSLSLSARSGVFASSGYGGDCSYHNYHWISLIILYLFIYCIHSLYLSHDNKLIRLSP